MYRRLLSSTLREGRKSILLLGPRQVGKSTLMLELAPDLVINLASEAEFLAHAGDPELLEQRLAVGRPKTVFIDEIQRLPRMLNTLQAILDRPKSPRFLLTGSSARKLRRGRANLLPGRIHAYQLGPLTLGELGGAFTEAEALSTGTLPGVYADPDPKSRRKTLRTYASTYVREEIQAEALTRNIEGFVRFLRVAASGSGQFVDQTRMAKEAFVSRTTVQRYYEILEDTLLAHRIDAFARSERRQLVQHPKYYVFDVGVYNALVSSFDLSGDRIGTVFEHFIVSQVRALADALDVPVRLATYRTENGAEVDLILELPREVWAVELKAARTVGANDTRGLRSFAAYYGKPHRQLLVFRGPHALAIGDVEVMPYRTFLTTLAGALDAT